MKKDPFQYIFRFCCDPGFNDEAEIPALLRYVDEAKIDDVACSPMSRRSTPVI